MRHGGEPGRSRNPVKAGPLFVAAERLEKEKRDADARQLFEARLRLSPWRTEHSATRTAWPSTTPSR